MRRDFSTSPAEIPICSLPADPTSIHANEKMLTRPKVREVAAVGMPDTKWGGIGVAAVDFPTQRRATACAVKPPVDCRAALRTKAGLVKAGHILSDVSIVGGQPMLVLATSFEGDR